MIRDSILLLAYQARILTGTARRHPLTTALASILWLAFALVTFSVGFGLGALAANHVGEREATVAGITGLFSGFTVVMSITFALSSLYFASDLEYLSSLPVRSRSMFTSRLAAQSLLGISLGAALAGPATLGFLAEQGVLGATAAILLSLASMAVWGVCIGTAITVVAVRLVPARYVRDASAIVATLAIFLVAAINLALRGPDAFTTLGPGDLHLSAVGSQVTHQLWFWGSWVANAINLAVSRDWLGSWLWCALLVGSAVLLLLLLPLALERAYVTGAERNRNASSGSRGAGSWQVNRYPAGLALMFKDLRMLKRDGAELAQLLLPMSLFALYLGSPAGSSAFLHSILPPWYGIALKSAFASMFVASGLGLRAIAFENRAIWLLKAAAIDSRRVVINKFLLVFGISAVFAITLLWIGEFRAGLSLINDVVPSTLLIVALTFGTVAFAIALGSVRPRFGWSDPRRSLSILVVICFLLGSFVFLSGFFVLLALGSVLNAGSLAAIVDLALALGCIGGGALLLRGSATRFEAIQV